MSFAQLLVDGSLRSTFVLLTVLVAGLGVSLGTILTQVIASRIARRGARQFLAVTVTAFAAVLLTAIFGQRLTQTTANVVAGIRSDRSVSICFMPTEHVLRDSIPSAVVALASAGYVLAVRRRSAQALPA